MPKPHGENKTGRFSTLGVAFLRFVFVFAVLMVQTQGLETLALSSIPTQVPDVEHLNLDLPHRVFLYLPAALQGTWISPTPPSFIKQTTKTGLCLSPRDTHLLCFLVEP